MKLKTALSAGLIALGAAGTASAANCTCRPVHHTHHVVYRHRFRAAPEPVVYGYAYPVPYVVNVAPPPVYAYSYPTFGYAWPGYRRGYGYGGGYERGLRGGYGREGFEGRQFGYGGYARDRFGERDGGRYAR